MKKPTGSPLSPRRLLLPLLSVLLLAAPAAATWSVVAVDTHTGEVCVASATCLKGFDLERYLPVIRVGEGAAAAQSYVDMSGKNRKKIWIMLQAGTPPQSIINRLASFDTGHQTRQYGVVNMLHDPATFTGTACGAAVGGVTGIDGDVRYAIQGNVLTGPEVVLAAEVALLRAEGDLSQRVMEAMRAARMLGGDGRCSCNAGAPTSCGVPPPSFTKSADVAFIVLARMGDIDGLCNAQVGCASGSYYLDLQVWNGALWPDPVDKLQFKYDEWRASLAGRPDHILSRVQPSAERLPADGITTMRVGLVLVDLDGVPLSAGGAAVTVETLDGSPGHASPGPVTDHGDGRYDFVLTAGTSPGLDTWKITVDDGAGPVVLYPYLDVAVDPAAELHVGYDSVPAGPALRIPFVIDLGPAEAGRAFRLLGTAAGTSPGQSSGGLTLPLNPGPFFTLTRTAAGPPLLPGAVGTLDAAGRARAFFQPPAGFLTAFAGQRLDWAAIVWSSPPRIAGPVGFEVRP